MSFQDCTIIEIEDGFTNTIWSRQEPSAHSDLSRPDSSSRVSLLDSQPATTGGYDNGPFNKRTNWKRLCQSHWLQIAIIHFVGLVIAVLCRAGRLRRRARNQQRQSPPRSRLQPTKLDTRRTRGYGPRNMDSDRPKNVPKREKVVLPRGGPNNTKTTRKPPVQGKSLGSAFISKYLFSDNTQPIIVTWSGTMDVKIIKKLRIPGIKKLLDIPKYI
uniref:Uncharacterized protein n=1 Tax=Sipha flava TaxID=143950 RepID=A0A2S2QJL8_9HEMI